MGIHSLSNSMHAISNISIINVDEPEPKEDTGVYIGKTMVYRIPFFLDSSLLVNPHISIIGMTGSGKTYFLRGYITRKVLYQNSSLFIIDWNGEYDETIRFLGGEITKYKSNSKIDYLLLRDGVNSINLAHLDNDRERMVAANTIVNSIIEAMHGMPIGDKMEKLIVLDEAWKMLGETKLLSQLFREGRKYNFSVIISTQLAKDIANDTIANSGSIFIFRLQNSDDYSLLVDAGIISPTNKNTISGLNVGSCMLRLAYKSENLHKNFFIKKVDGFSIYAYTIAGDGMQISVSNQKFQEITDRAFKDNLIRGKVIEFIESNGRSVDLKGFIALLIRLGICRGEIVVYLRLLGANDTDIMLAYRDISGLGVILQDGCNDG
ncbi:MAG: DUF87 domain-containing protein [Candidatus Marsarchaeota archaeon]|nr:DUF87 domain-containing protein [Candidatus Marsarchaeota archaeon]